MTVNKVMYIQAFGVPITKEVTKKVPTGETERGWFGIPKKVMAKVTENQEVGTSDSQVDAVRLSNDLAKAVEQMNADGYELVSVTPIISGDYNYHVQEGNGLKKHAHKSSYAFGYGFSFTEGLTVIFKKSD